VGGSKQASTRKLGGKLSDSLIFLISFHDLFLALFLVSYFMFHVFFLLSFMFVSCFILVCTLDFFAKLLVIDGTPKNWSSTYG